MPAIQFVVLMLIVNTLIIKYQKEDRLACWENIAKHKVKRNVTDPNGKVSGTLDQNMLVALTVPNRVNRIESNLRQPSILIKRNNMKTQRNAVKEINKYTADKLDNLRIFLIAVTGGYAIRENKGCFLIAS
jgi:hypothetical protein